MLQKIVFYSYPFILVIVFSTVSWAQTTTGTTPKTTTSTVSQPGLPNLGSTSPTPPSKTSTTPPSTTLNSGTSSTGTSTGGLRGTSSTDFSEVDGTTNPITNTVNNGGGLNTTYISVAVGIIVMVAIILFFILRKKKRQAQFGLLTNPMNPLAAPLPGEVNYTPPAIQQPIPVTGPTNLPPAPSLPGEQTPEDDYSYKPTVNNSPTAPNTIMPPISTPPSFVATPTQVSSSIEMTQPVTNQPLNSPPASSIYPEPSANSNLGLTGINQSPTSMIPEPALPPLKPQSQTASLPTPPAINPVPLPPPPPTPPIPPVPPTPPITGQ